MDKLKFLLKVAVSLGLFAYLGMTVSWQELLGALRSVNVGLFLLSFVVLVSCAYPVGMRLVALLAPTVLKPSLMRVIEVMFISIFYSLMLPSGIGLSAVRWYKITLNKIGRGAMLAVTVIEWAMLALTIAFFTGLPLVLFQDSHIEQYRGPLLTMCMLLFVAALGFFLFVLVPGLQGWAQGKAQGLSDMLPWESAKKLIGVHEHLVPYARAPRHVAEAFFHHMVYQLMNLLRFYLAFLAVGVRLPMHTVIWMSMLMIFVNNLPVSFAGLGVRETGFAWILALYGLAPETGVVLGAAISAQTLMLVAMGGAMALMERARDDNEQPT